MSKTHPNSPAFKYIEVATPGSCETFIRGGLTIRTYLAALAMQGMCSGETTLGSATDSDISFVARRSVAMADALIEELNKDKE